MSKRQQRRYLSNEQKLAIVREHLVEGISIADLADKHHVEPSLIYRWQRQLFENGAVAFGPKPKDRSKPDKSESRVKHLEERLRRKDEVISELLEEHTALKKSIDGEL
jgi:transposase-like protein